MKKVFFFDRDGTLIENIPYLNDYKKIKYFKDTFSTLKMLRDLGYEFIIITNQSGLARGLITYEQMTEVHKKMRSDFSSEGIDLLDILYAPYHPTSDHPWRKPNPGMILESFRRYNIDKENSYVVGDNITDIGVAVNAGLKSFFLSGEAKDTICINNLSEIKNHL